MTCGKLTLNILATALFLLARLHSASINETESNPSDIRIVPVMPTPEPEFAKIHYVFPQEGEIKNKNPVNVQVQETGFPLGVNSDFLRAKEILNNKRGQSLHVIVDNHPYFIVYQEVVDALDDNILYFDQTLNFDIPFNLEPGEHVIRMFPVRSFNESLKGEGCFAARTFYFKTKKNNPEIDLSIPYLTYNQPQGRYPGNSSQPILLDFYISNCELSKDGYKVRITIDNTITRVLTLWTPYYIYGLKKGSHKIQLELIDPQNKPVVGMFNNAQQIITIEE